MNFGNRGCNLDAPYTKQELKNVREAQIARYRESLQNDINKGYEHIKFCNEKLNDSEFIKSQTAENVKALVLLRIQFTEQVDGYLSNLNNHPVS